MKIAYLGLGSNVGDREANLAGALERLGSAGVHILRRSSIYETEPQDVRDQPWFLNQVVEIETEFSPMQLLAQIRKIEDEMGRKREAAKGPRVIDIDILFVGDSVIVTNELQVPHMSLSVRRFVLEPLAELAPDLRHPVLHKTVSELLLATQSQLVRRL